MTADRPCILIIGNFLSSSGLNKSVCEELALRLEAAGWSVITTSRQKNRILRLLDMLWTAWRMREQYGVVQIDVFSGPSFIWAETVYWLRRRGALGTHDDGTCRDADRGHALYGGVNVRRIRFR